MASVKHRKSYNLKYKLDAVEYAEMNSNDKAAKKFQVGKYAHCDMYQVILIRIFL